MRTGKIGQRAGCPALAAAVEKIADFLQPDRR
jgi:hypothetical protein